MPADVCIVSRSCRKDCMSHCGLYKAMKQVSHVQNSSVIATYCETHPGLGVLPVEHL
jgi:hypothetical protein